MFTKDLVHTLLNRAGNGNEMLAVIDALVEPEEVQETVEETPQVQEVKVKSKKAKTKVENHLPILDQTVPESDEIAF